MKCPVEMSLQQFGSWKSPSSQTDELSGTNSDLTLWSWALLERPLDSFWALCGTRRSITAFTRALHSSLSWARPSQSTPPHPISSISILILSTHLCPGFPGGLFPSSNYTWRRVQITKLLIIQFSPLSCHFIQLRSKYPTPHRSQTPSVYVPP
jgi:hypothetical protein